MSKLLSDLFEPGPPSPTLTRQLWEKQSLSSSLIALLLLSCLGAGAQTLPGVSLTKSGTADQQGAPYVLHQFVDEVLLYCTVLDRQGHMVNDLQKQDFAVHEGKLGVPVSSFRHQDDPVSMGLVIDNSGSMKSKRDAVNAAALALVRASNPDDEAFILNFADQSYMDQDFTGDLEKLRRGLDKGRVAGGGTALFDTLIAATDHLAKEGHRAKQAIVVVTDGKDNASIASLEQAIRRVQQTNGPVVYTIGLLYEGGAGGHQAHHALEELADETGGIAFFPRSLAEVGPIADEVARDLRAQYRLSFHPPPASSTDPYHSITVEVRSRGKLRVRTRKGYVRTSSTPHP